MSLSLYHRDGAPFVVPGRVIVSTTSTDVGDVVRVVFPGMGMPPTTFRVTEPGKAVAWGWPKEIADAVAEVAKGTGTQRVRLGYAEREFLLTKDIPNHDHVWCDEDLLAVWLLTFNADEVRTVLRRRGFDVIGPGHTPGFN